MWRFSKYVCTILAVVACAAIAQAQQPAAGQAKAAAASKPLDSEALPGWLEKLQLAPQQISQIQAIVRDFDAQLAETWRQCGDRYKATIQTEAFLLAAIEASFTDAQRKQARDHRHNLTPPVAAAAAKKAAADAGDAKAAATTAEEAAALGVVLTAEQIAAAGKLQEKFQPRLQALGDEIRTLHNRLIALEMDRLEAIEKVLTDQQRKLLGEMRQSPPSQTR